MNDVEAIPPETCAPSTWGERIYYNSYITSSFIPCDWRQPSWDMCPFYVVKTQVHSFYEYIYRALVGAAISQTGF